MTTLPAIEELPRESVIRSPAVDIRVVPASAFGAACADAFIDSLGTIESPVVGLATGNTPTAMYRELAERGRREQFWAQGIRAFAIDEYGGPPTHRCSNAAYFRELWEPIAGATPVRGFDVGAQHLDAEAERFAHDVTGAGGLDVVVLGIGKNGHLAFNEPGSERDAPARAITLAPGTVDSARALWGDDVPAWGITLGLEELLAARTILLLANGPAKAAIVERALSGPLGSDCPASFLQEHPNVVVVLDEAAATPPLV